MRTSLISHDIHQYNVKYHFKYNSNVIKYKILNQNKNELSKSPKEKIFMHAFFNNSQSHLISLNIGSIDDTIEIICNYYFKHLRIFPSKTLEKNLMDILKLCIKEFVFEVPPR